MNQAPKYILVTPARDEAEHIGPLIQSVINQKIRPERWVVVDDGSTDGTQGIVKTYAALHPYIKLVESSHVKTRSFGSKAMAFQRGCRELVDCSYDFLGNLDADVTFDDCYYERMLAEMYADQQLGAVSGVVWDKTKTGFRRTLSSLNHAVGAVQFWRRECFEAIGGYQPASVGGVDSLAELKARMMGWTTRSLADVPVYHHKPVDSACGKTALRICYRAGQTEYHLGTHPIFAIAKAIRRWKEPPIILGSLGRLWGYAELWRGGVKRDAPDELVRYVRNEQLARFMPKCFSRSLSIR